MFPVSSKFSSLIEFSRLFVVADINLHVFPRSEFAGGPTTKIGHNVRDESSEITYSSQKFYPD